MGVVQPDSNVCHNVKYHRYWTTILCLDNNNSDDDDNNNNDSSKRKRINVFKTNRYYAWTIFNLIFISIYQHVLLFLITTPSIFAYVVATQCDNSSSNRNHGNNATNPFSFSSLYYSPNLNWLDAVGCIFFLGFVWLESIADNQQQQFQKKKKDYYYQQQQQQLQTSKNNINHNSNNDGAGDTNDIKVSAGVVTEYRQGFTKSGLYSIVRKPNYACEQCIWISFCIFSVSSCYSYNSYNYDYNSSSNTGGILEYMWNCCCGSFLLFNYSHIGWILLALLFQGSGSITEYISQSKYPKYAQYMSETPLYVPNLYHLIHTVCYWRNKKDDMISC